MIIKITTESVLALILVVFIILAVCNYYYEINDYKIKEDIKRGFCKDNGYGYNKGSCIEIVGSKVILHKIIQIDNKYYIEESIK